MAERADEQPPVVPPPHGTGSGDTGEVLTLYEEMHRRMAGLPGVIGVALGSTVPLRTSDFMLDVAVDGQVPRPGEPTPRAEYRTASPEYFEVAGIPILRGRAFASTDRGEAERVVILSQRLADQLFPDPDPIGRKVDWMGDVLRFIPVSGDWRTVVGVAGDTLDGVPQTQRHAGRLLRRLALLIAGVGVAGMLAFSVARRTGEHPDESRRRHRSGASHGPR